MLVGAWENEEPKEPNPQLAGMIDATPAKVSPVYCMDVHSEAVWLVTGTGSGHVNLWSVRHKEGKVEWLTLVYSFHQGT